MYRDVLLSGCRCVEIDCVDGSHGEPVVTHKGAAVNSILITEVLEAIKETAFVTSKYPVIISLEMHLSSSQQEKFANHVAHILGEENIYALRDFKKGRSFESPEQLKEKYILKVCMLLE